MVSKALVVGPYQRKGEELARLGVDLTVLVPPRWADRRGAQEAQFTHGEGYSLRSIPVRFNGNYHLHFYPTLGAELGRLQPSVLHMDEEPYNLATFLGLRAAVRQGVTATFFTWQNLFRRYPPPFAQMEKACYRWCPLAIAGSAEAGAVLRRKGYQGEIAVIPQFGVDPGVYCPAAGGDSLPEAGVVDPADAPCCRIGYAGGLLPEKGVDLLLRACAGLAGDWRLTLAGEGAEQAQLAALAGALDIADRVTFAGRIPGSRMPDFYRGLDVLVLPSRTTPTWKEQFGRVLIEAMATAAPVVGSSSGEIPHVIGDAGMIFPEGDSDALRRCLQELADDPVERRRLGAAGRRRVLDRYTMHQIAQETVTVYQELAQRSGQN